MPKFLCTTCGVQYPASEQPPARCLICEDERQFVGWEGQAWTTLAALRTTHRNRFEEMEPDLIRIGTEPSFGIGQHAFLVRTPSGNVLWDCITLLDEDTVERIRDLGGVSAIAVSHPHYYATLADWSVAFEGAPIYLHAADQGWIVDPTPSIRLWEGTSHPLAPGLTLVHGGGHFAGSAMLHWAAGAGGRGVLLAGDTVQVVYDRRWVSFMYSFVNYLPLPAEAVRHLTQALAPYAFERIYSPWVGRVVENHGKEVILRSAERYLRVLSGTSGAGSSA